MNLPAHGTASPDPSKASSSVKTTHQESKNNSVSAWLGPSAARRNCSRPPGGIHSPPGASVLPDPLFPRHRLAELTVPPGASQCRPSHAKTIAWRSSVTARRHTGSILQLVLALSLSRSHTRTPPQASFISFIMTLCKLPNHTPINLPRILASLVLY